MRKLFSALSDPLDYKPDWKSMSVRQKIRYILDYYRLPIIILCLIICAIGYACYRYAVRTDPILYVVPVNVVISEDNERILTDAYILQRNTSEEGRRDAVVLDSSLRLSTDPDTLYYRESQAARIKILAEITAGRLDVVLMNKEAFDFFSSSGFLADLGEITQLQDLSDHFAANTAILEDNADEIFQDPSKAYQSVTLEGKFGLDLSGSALFGEAAGYEDTVYLGIIINTERLNEAVSYARFCLTM